MSDAIREAFEEGYSYRNNMIIQESIFQRDENGDYYNEDIASEWKIWNDAWQAALQSQTAPAVPGASYGLHHVSRMYQVMRTHDSTIDDVALDSMRDTLRHVLTTPQPDHSPDAGKVVQESPAGWIWDAYGSRNFTAGTHHKNVLVADGLTLIPVYTHPTQPRNEVDAARYQWLKEEGFKYAWVEFDQLEPGIPVVDFRLVFTIPEPSDWMPYESGEWTLEQIDQAIDTARLRSNGGEG